MAPESSFPFAKTVPRNVNHHEYYNAQWRRRRRHAISPSSPTAIRREGGPNYGFYGHCPGGKSRVVVLEEYIRRVSLHVSFGNHQLINHKALNSHGDSRPGNYRIRFCRLNIFSTWVNLLPPLRGRALSGIEKAVCSPLSSSSSDFLLM